jgi:hypothetical protein
VFYTVYKGGGKAPYVKYMTLEDELGSGFVSSTPDLVELVRTYNPNTSFVIFDAVINLDSSLLEQVKIDIFSFLTGQPTLSA